MTDQEWLNETHILDVWIKEKFGWETVNWCVIGNEELFIWLDNKIYPTFFQLKELSELLQTESIVIKTNIGNPCGYSILDTIEAEDELENWTFITLHIKDWNLSNLKSYLIKKRLAYKDDSDEFPRKLLVQEGFLSE